VGFSPRGILALHFDCRALTFPNYEIGKDPDVNTNLATANSELTSAPTRRINQALTASVEKRALLWMAHRAPHWLTSDQLTALGLAAQIGAGACYALSRYNRYALLGVIVCIALNWLGDSLDGTLARVRRQERPRYGFYVDHIVDIFGSIALMCGLACSGFLHWQTAIAMLIAFLLLSSESYLATHTLSCFQLSQGIFGPTEIRILLIIGNLALLRSPYSTILGHKMLLFDLGGTIAAVGMFAMAIFTTARHTAELYRQEPLP
jgi:archaetidylinositol phosphate synthase